MTSFTYTPGKTNLYAFKEGLSFSTWVANRILATEDSSPNTGRYQVTLPEAGSTYYLFDGITQPTGWDQNIGTITPEAPGSSPFSEQDAKQIRYRLHIDGETEEPTTESPPAIVIPPPENPDCVTGWGVYTLNGTPKIDSDLFIQLLKGPGEDGRILSTAPVTITTDEDGLVTYNEFVIGATYAIWVNNRVKAVTFVVPDDSFPLPETLDW